MSDSYEFMGFTVSAHMLSSMKAYAEMGRLTGGFLKAVICNDLVEACRRADLENLQNLLAFVGWFYNEAPGVCWGSKEKMDAWIKSKDEARKGN